MFGNNRIEKADHSDGSSLDVIDIWYTIQGEGPWAGLPAVFVRLAGCNLACTFCDTDFETNRKRMTVEAIVAKALSLFPTWCGMRVVLTGGEPFRQNICPLILALNKAGGDGCRVQIETAGTLTLNPQAMSLLFGGSRTNLIVVSPKTAKIDPLIEKYAYCYKYIVRAGDQNHFTPQQSTQGLAVVKPLFCPKTTPLGPIDSVIYVQPMDEQDEVKNRANAEHTARLAMKHNLRISIQMHKICGVA